METTALKRPVRPIVALNCRTAMGFPTSDPFGLQGVKSIGLKNRPEAGPKKLLKSQIENILVENASRALLPA